MRFDPEEEIMMMKIAEFIVEHLNYDLYYTPLDFNKATIQNIVASATIGEAIDLRTASKAFPRVWYEPENFRGLVFRL